MRITELQPIIQNSILGEETKGFANLKSVSNAQYTEEKILPGLEYRPDLIADYYLGDSSLAWLITCANNFENGLEDYYLGRKLKIPRV